MIAYKIPNHWYSVTFALNRDAIIDPLYQIECYKFTDAIIEIIKPYNGYMVMRNILVPWPSSQYQNQNNTISLAHPFVAFNNDDDAVLFKLTYM
jgi:hypothetical protein